MNFDDLTDEQKEVWDYVFEIAHDAGWEAGYDAAISEEQNDEYDTGYHNGYQAGIEAEQNRIQSVLGMMFESALNMGQGTKAVQYKHAMDLLRPIDIKPVVDEDF